MAISLKNRHVSSQLSNWKWGRGSGPVYPQTKHRKVEPESYPTVTVSALLTIGTSLPSLCSFSRSGIYNIWTTLRSKPLRSLPTLSSFDLRSIVFWNFSPNQESPQKVEYIITYLLFSQSFIRQASSEIHFYAAFIFLFILNGKILYTLAQYMEESRRKNESIGQ